jgi:hypothetical protein
VFRRVAQSGLLNSVKCLHIKSLITIKSEGLLLALPFLTELTLVGDREVQFLAQSFQSKKPNVKVTAVNG